MSTQEKLEKIKEVCITANPELKTRFPELNTVSRPIQLADVMMMLKEIGTAYDYGLTDKGVFFWMNPQDDDNPLGVVFKPTWNLTKPLDGQTPECIDFLYQLLS